MILNGGGRVAQCGRTSRQVLDAAAVLVTMRALRAAVLACLFGLVGCTSPAYIGPLAFDDLPEHAHGQQSQYCYDAESPQCPESHEGPWVLVLADQDAWARFWSAHRHSDTPVQEPPSVDWGRHVVVAAVLGQQADYNHGIQVVELRSADDGTHAQLRVSAPMAHCPTLPAIGNPYHIVVVQRPGHVVWSPIQLAAESIAYDCPGWT